MVQVNIAKTKNKTRKEKRKCRIVSYQVRIVRQSRNTGFLLTTSLHAILFTNFLYSVFVREFQMHRDRLTAALLHGSEAKAEATDRLFTTLFVLMICAGSVNETDDGGGDGTDSETLP